MEESLVPRYWTILSSHMVKHTPWKRQKVMPEMTKNQGFAPKIPFGFLGVIGHLVPQPVVRVKSPEQECALMENMVEQSAPQKITKMNTSSVKAFQIVQKIVF
jgi:hypothetical protein